MVAALIGFGWWWFLNQAQTMPPANNGSFGSAGNRQNSTSTSTSPNTNIGLPTIPTTPTNTRFSPGTYNFSTLAGKSIGTYIASLSDQYPGNYTISPSTGGQPLLPGTYIISVGGTSVGTVTVSPSGVVTSTSTPMYTVDFTSATTTPITTATTTIPYAIGTSTIGAYNTPGATWLSNGTSTNNNSASVYYGTVFNPTAINQVQGSNGGGVYGGTLPNLSFGGTGTGSSGGMGLGGSLLAAAGAGAVSCAGLYLAAQMGLMTPNSIFSVQINNGIDNGKDVLDCIARGIAKAAVQQITVSVVNWINNGFEGSPAFVTHPDRFFSNIANQTAGNYIQSSALSFLCSPFQLQIRIAIAQSYANGNRANSCSLTKVIGNVQSFMNGNFYSGGWPGFLAFTTVPTNNPYGAYAYGSVGLSAALSVTIKGQQLDLLSGNQFLTLKKKENCKTTDSPPDKSNSVSVSAIDGSGADTGTQLYQVCDLVSTTPGSIIFGSLDKTLGQGRDSLNLAQNFDQIVSALLTQLMTKALQGLSSIGGPSGDYASNFYTSDQLAAQNSALQIVSDLQAGVGIAQQYASVSQGSISDIQSTQSGLNNLYNCWERNIVAIQTNPPASVSSNADTLVQQFQLQAEQASSTFKQLQERVDFFNNTIITANNSIVFLEQLQSRAVSITSSADVDSIKNDYNSTRDQGQVFTSADLTTAQQDRTTLQSQLSTINQQTTAGLQQCRNAI